MLHNGNFNFTDYTGFDNFGIFGGSNDEKNTGFFDLQNYQDAGPSNIDNPWYLRTPEVGGMSQPYKGVEVSGDLSYLDSPTTAPISLYPGNGVPLDDGKSHSLSPKIVQRLIYLSQDTTHISARARSSPNRRKSRTRFQFFPPI